MGFLSLVVALLLEQVRPLGRHNWCYQLFRTAASSLERNFNAGESQQGLLAWMILVLPAVILTWATYLWIRPYSVIGALIWNVAVLYLTLGFRQFSHFYTSIQLALANGDLAEARLLLAEWKQLETPGFNAAELSVEDVARIAIEEALVASHRHVFGVFFWFVVLPGPSGAVLYRLADFAARAWNRAGEEPFGRFARRAFAVIDWLPVRMTAIGFAIVGNFEDAIWLLRENAFRFTDTTRGILIASGAGALGVRLGDVQNLRRAAPAETDAAIEGLPGVDASPAAMNSAVGLVWRSLVLWMVLLFAVWVPGAIYLH
jgi:adenosylcobinamide-phosphate synthase